MGRDQHRFTLVAQLPQQADDPGFGFDVHAGKRLVEQDHLALLGNRTGQKHALLLPAGQLANLPMAQLEHIYTLQGVGDDLLIAFFGTTQKPHMPVAAHHHHVLDEHRKRPVDLFRLRHVGDQVLTQRPVRRQPQNRDSAARRPHKPHHRLKQRGLAGTVHANQGGNRSARHAERCVAQRRVAVAVGHGHVGYNNPLVHGYSFMPSRMPCTSVRVVTFSRSI